MLVATSMPSSCLPEVICDLFLLKTEVFLLERENGSNSCPTKADKDPSLSETGSYFRSLKQISFFS